MTILRAHVLKKNPPRAIFRSRSWLECAWQHGSHPIFAFISPGLLRIFANRKHGAGVVLDTALDCLPQATAASPPPFCSLLTFCPTQRAASITASRPTAARRLPPPRWHRRPTIVRKMPTGALLGFWLALIIALDRQADSSASSASSISLSTAPRCLCGTMHDACGMRPQESYS